MGAPIEDLHGMSFGRLTVTGSYETRGRSGGWRCTCACGEVKWVNAQSLKKGLTQSCGCLHRELASGKKTTHGMTDTPTYNSWASMWQRCTNPNSPRYPSHGGRGIKVCSQWESFEQFLMDMGYRPQGKSLDRMNNDGDYTPSNCRWATPGEQSSNTRSAKLVTLDGITDTHAGWARRVSISPATLCKRLKRGWTFEEAVLG